MNQSIELTKGNQVFPDRKDPDAFVGNIVEGEDGFSALIISMVDQQKDRYNDDPLFNYMCNKFWACKMTGEFIIVCLDWHFPEDFTKTKFYEPIWTVRSIVQTNSGESGADLRQETGDGPTHEGHAAIAEKEEEPS